MAQTQIHGKELIKMQIQGNPKNLLVLRNYRTTRFFDIHPLVEEFNAEHGTNLRVISHKVADVALNVGEAWKSLASGSPFAVDASIAYEKPGVKLEKEIVFSSFQGEPRVVSATGKYNGEKNISLVALGISGKDFKKDGREIRLDIPDERFIVVPDFPDQNGWYMPHAETGVPHGKKVESSPDARYLWRLNDSSYVGLVARVCFYNYRRYVDLYYRSSFALGVAVEVPEGDVAKIEALLIPSAVPKTDKKLVIEVAGVSADGLRALLGKFRQDLATLGADSKDEVLAAGRKLEAIFSGAYLRD